MQAERSNNQLRDNTNVDQQPSSGPEPHHPAISPYSWGALLPEIPREKGPERSDNGRQLSTSQKQLLSETSGHFDFVILSNHKTGSTVVLCGESHRGPREAFEAAKKVAGAFDNAAIESVNWRSYPLGGLLKALYRVNDLIVKASLGRYPAVIGVLREGAKEPTSKPDKVTRLEEGHRGTWFSSLELGLKLVTAPAVFSTALLSIPALISTSPKWGLAVGAMACSLVMGSLVKTMVDLMALSERRGHLKSRNDTMVKELDKLLSERPESSPLLVCMGKRHIEDFASLLEDRGFECEQRFGKGVEESSL